MGYLGPRLECVVVKIASHPLHTARMWLVLQLSDARKVFKVALQPPSFFSAVFAAVAVLSLIGLAPKYELVTICPIHHLYYLVGGSINSLITGSEQ